MWIWWTWCWLVTGSDKIEINRAVEQTSSLEARSERRSEIESKLKVDRDPIQSRSLEITGIESGRLIRALNQRREDVLFGAAWQLAWSLRSRIGLALTSSPNDDDNNDCPLLLLFSIGHALASRQTQSLACLGARTPGPIVAACLLALPWQQPHSLTHSRGRFHFCWLAGGRPHTRV